MKKNSIKFIITISTLLSFIVISNLVIQFNTPITYSGGCTEKEYEAINYILEKIEENSFLFTDLRLSAVLRVLTNLAIITAPGSVSSSFFEINTTYYAFYSNNSLKAYISIKNLISSYFSGIEIKEFYVFFSKLYVIEGFSTKDYNLGPISNESYEKYLNSTFFDVIFENDQCFIVKNN